MLSVDAIQDRYIALVLVPLAYRPIGTVGGCMSTNRLGVATATALLCGEQFPAASHADTA